MLIENFETRNTVKFSCYKASKGFGNKGKQLCDSRLLPKFYMNEPRGMKPLKLTCEVMHAQVQVEKTIISTVHIKELQEQFSKATELEIKESSIIYNRSHCTTSRKNAMSECLCFLSNCNLIDTLWNRGHLENV